MDISSSAPRWPHLSPGKARGHATTLSPEALKTLALELGAALPPMPCACAQMPDRLASSAVRIARAYAEATPAQRAALDAVAAAFSAPDVAP